MQDKNGVYEYEIIGHRNGYVDVLKCGRTYYVPYRNGQGVDYLTMREALRYKRSRGQWDKCTISFHKDDDWYNKLWEGDNEL